MPTFNLSYYKQLKQLVAKKESLLTGKDYFLDPTVQELLTLEASIANQGFYNNKKKYFVLIQKYLNETIDPNIFRAQLIELVNEDMKEYEDIINNFEELSTFWIDSELDKFSSPFNNIHETCLGAFDYEGEISETTFRDSIQKNFFKIQKYFE